MRGPVCLGPLLTEMTERYSLLYAATERGQKRRYGVGGGSYISVVEFGPSVRALSVHTFGASGHPNSRHFTDQAELYARGEFKPAWLKLKDIRAHLEAAYHPGEERRQASWYATRN